MFAREGEQLVDLRGEGLFLWGDLLLHVERRAWAFAGQVRSLEPAGLGVRDPLALDHVTARGSRWAGRGRNLRDVHVGHDRRLLGDQIGGGCLGPPGFVQVFARVDLLLVGGFLDLLC